MLQILVVGVGVLACLGSVRLLLGPDRGSKLGDHEAWIVFSIGLGLIAFGLVWFPRFFDWLLG